jgi:hypothetical protein
MEWRKPPRLAHAIRGVAGIEDGLAAAGSRQLLQRVHTVLICCRARA